MAIESPTELVIDVSYAEPLRAFVKTYRMTAPATVADALRQAAADPDFAGIDVLHKPVGIFGKIATHEEPLRDGDRVELYRPLAADPKIARRERVQRARRLR